MNIMAAHRLILTTVALLALAPAASAQQTGAPDRAGPPAAFQRAVQCRTIADPGERLACYDREVAALESAEASQAIRVVDRADLRRTRRSLFGLVLPDLGRLFGGNDEGPEAVTEINSTIRSVQDDGRRRYTFVLDDGARWQQIDAVRTLRNDPRPGDPIRIRRAAMGSYLANVNREVAIRVRRVN